MVYCGKPSKGCQMCRARRIKCDETRPVCSQCSKSRRHCPGYRDEFDLVLRNETKATERRAKKEAQKKTSALRQQDPTRGGAVASVSLSAASSAVLSISPAIQIPAEIQASYYFISNFVLVPRETSTAGFLDFLVPLLKTEPRSSPMQYAFNACAMASLGNRVRSETVNFHDRARVQYDQAIRATHIALTNPETSKSDSTLTAVLLMSMFETITASQPAESAWGSHIEGAIQLVKARGRKQLRTKIGLLLFMFVRSHLSVLVLSTPKAPIMGTDWWIKDAINDTFATACQRINLRTGELRAELSWLTAAGKRTPENAELVRGLLRRAQSLSQEAADWALSLPEQWRYRTLSVDARSSGGGSTGSEVFQGRADMYSDFYIASVWNFNRVARIILASVRVRCAAWLCAPADYRTTPEYAATSLINAEMAADIIASVPYQLGWHRRRRRRLASEAPELSSFACGEHEATRALPGQFLMFPLACVIAHDSSTDAQRQWVAGRLRYIGDELGLRYAHTLSHIKFRTPSMLVRADLAALKQT